MALVTTETNPDTGVKKKRVNLGREPTTRFRDLDGRHKKFFLKSVLTLMTIGILGVYLLPFAYMMVTSVKTEDQIAQGTILPKSVEIYEYASVEFDLVRVTDGDGNVQALTVLPAGSGGADAEVFVWHGHWDELNEVVAAEGIDIADAELYTAGSAGRAGSGVSLLLPGADPAVLVGGVGAPEPLEFDGSETSLEAALAESGYAPDEVALFTMPDPDGDNPSLALLRPGAAVNALIPPDQLPIRVATWDFTYAGLETESEAILGVGLDELGVYTVPDADGTVNGVGFLPPDGDVSAFLDPAVTIPETVALVEVTEDGVDPTFATLDEAFLVAVRELDMYNVPQPDGTTEQMALLTVGAEESVFVDPQDPDAEPFVWQGRIQTIEPVLYFDPTLENFPEAWDAMDFGVKLRNTAVIAGLGMAGTIISSTLVAYGLSRFRIPFKGVILGSLIATIILPRFVTLVPTYIMWERLGFVGTWWPLIIPHFFANAYNVFLLRQFFLTIPRDLDEAAAIDGAGPMKTLLTVILPQAKGAILAISLFHFFFAWNDFLEPLLYLAAKPNLQPISIGLYQFLGLYDANIPLIQAGALLGMLVPVIVFLLLQRIFLRGIDLSGSVK